MTKHVLAAIAVVAMVTTTAHADKFIPFRDFRDVDATGTYYVVVKEDKVDPKNPGAGRSATFEYVIQRPNSPPVPPSRGPRNRDHYPEVKVRNGDTVLARGKLEVLPQETVLSTTGLGFACFKVHGHFELDANAKNAVVVVDSEGKVQHRLSINDLFSADDQARFVRRYSVSWDDGGWYDERRREFVVVSSARGPNGKIPRQIRVIDLATGAVRHGSSQEIATALTDDNRGALEFALQLAAELKLKECEQGLIRHFDDATLTKMARLRAAVALAALGDRRGSTMMAKVALDKPADNGQARIFAISNLPHVLGDRAAAVLCDCVCNFEKDGEVTRSARDAMYLVSAEAAVPQLIKLLDEKGSKEKISFCCECLSRKGPQAKSAVPSLIQVLRDTILPDNLLSKHECAAIALGNIGPDANDALPDLILHAKILAPEEWHRAKDQQPTRRKDNFGGHKYSDNAFINAIWKIREK